MGVLEFNVLVLVPCDVWVLSCSSYKVALVVVLLVEAGG